MSAPAGKVKFSTRLSVADYEALVAAAEGSERSVSAEAAHRLKRSLVVESVAGALDSVLDPRWPLRPELEREA